MDVSQVQSGSKCSSDFSIERILSDDRVREVPQTPSWLWCTRYQPPRIPRASGSGGGAGGGRARRSGRHARVPFTSAQARALEAAYARAPYLAPPALRALAAALQLRDDRIKIWFQNRRARERREKCSNISPPGAVTLPPTAFLPTNSSTITNTNSWPYCTGQKPQPCGTEAPEDFSKCIVPVPRLTSDCAEDIHDERPGQTRCESPLEVDIETVEDT